METDSDCVPVLMSVSLFVLCDRERGAVVLVFLGSELV